MQKSSLTSIVLNLDTIDEAWQVDKNLWCEVLLNKTIILLAPEQLKKDQFQDLLHVKTFYKHIYTLRVDEAHLIYFWGARLQPLPHQLGFLQAHLPSHSNSRTACHLVDMYKWTCIHEHRWGNIWCQWHRCLGRWEVKRNPGLRGL